MTGAVMFLISLIIVAVLTLILVFMLASKRAKKTGVSTSKILLSVNALTLLTLLVFLVLGIMALFVIYAEL